MKLQILCTVSLIALLTGCIHTETIHTRDLSQRRSQEVSRSMPGHVAKLTFTDGTTVRGRAVQVTPDSVSWIDAASQTLRSCSLGAIEKVSYHDALKGARTGALIGAGVGIFAGLGWSIYDISAQSTSIHVSPYVVALTAAAILGVPATLAGGTVGAILGEREQYVFTPQRAD